MRNNQSKSEKLCLSCGLCCNGAIFGDVRLLPEEDPTRLQALGLDVSRVDPKRQGAAVRPAWRFLQPCVAFDGCRCRIYPSRPKHCRNFECLLLKRVGSGQVTEREALRIIRDVRRRVAQVDTLLQGLGSCDPGVALGERFRQMAKRLERAKPDAETASKFGQLTVAFHGLNMILQKDFYPSPAP